MSIGLNPDRNIGRLNLIAWSTQRTEVINMLLEDIILEKKMIKGAPFTFIDLEEAIGQRREVGYMNFYYMAFTNDVEDYKAVVFLSTRDQKKQYKYYITDTGAIYPAKRASVNQYTFKHFEIIEAARKVYAKYLKAEEEDTSENVTVTVTEEEAELMQYDEVDRDVALDLLQDIKGVGKVKAKKILDAYMTGRTPEGISDKILNQAKGVLEGVAIV